VALTLFVLSLTFANQWRFLGGRWASEGARLVGESADWHGFAFASFRR
jgi:hypothetical protein